MNDGLWALAGVALTAAFALMTQGIQRHHERVSRNDERRDRDKQQDRARFEEVYRLAATRLTAARDALHRFAHAIYTFEHEGGYQPYSLTGSRDCAIEEADAMRGAQSLLALFGTPVVVAEYEDAMELATGMREMLSDERDNWDGRWFAAEVEKFDTHYRAAIEQMQRDLQSVRRSSLAVRPAQTGGVTPPA